jgi:hypothetical protein
VLHLQHLEPLLSGSLTTASLWSPTAFLRGRSDWIVPLIVTGEREPGDSQREITRTAREIARLLSRPQTIRGFGPIALRIAHDVTPPPMGNGCARVSICVCSRLLTAEKLRDLSPGTHRGRCTSATQAQNLILTVLTAIADLVFFCVPEESRKMAYVVRAIHPDGVRLAVRVERSTLREAKESAKSLREEGMGAVGPDGKIIDETKEDP